MFSSLEIAQGATLRPIADVAAEAGIEADELEQYGRHKAVSYTHLTLPTKA